MTAGATRKLFGFGVIALLLSAVAGCATNGKEPNVTSGSSTANAAAVTPAQAREIAKDAYVYGFPMIDGNRIQYAYFADPQNPEYKGAWNQIHNTARVFTPADTAVQTPNYAFWSLTMYELPASLLVANPINRYLINSPMLDTLAKDPDGGITLYIQNQSPGPGKESNWLPAPQGPFQMFARLYWPKDEALNGQWKPPQPTKT